MIIKFSIILKRLVKRHGFLNTLKFGIKVTTQYIKLKLHKSKNFVFNGKEYQYYFNFLNGTHTNERIVEIPIIKEIIMKNISQSILEIGNVMSKYIPFEHDIVDKYEKGIEIINEDIVKFIPDKKYDLIISVSTLEHVGFDEEIKEPQKILRVFDNIKKMISKNGKIIVTMPLGYNKFLDNCIEEKKLGFTEEYYLKRRSSNLWEQVNSINFKKAKYNESIPPHANELFVGVISNSKD